MYITCSSLLFTTFLLATGETSAAYAEPEGNRERLRRSSHFSDYFNLRSFFLLSRNFLQPSPLGSTTDIPRNMLQ
ncbi:hypothetical protein V6N11_080582 [Hibiscus sabdariffa]|uniref:Secreted protein n=1 Tax=Hibiscus sabdariffa TaxID=183260 RepID=A0ABR2R8N8_9ROSI